MKRTVNLLGPEGWDTFCSEAEALGPAQLLPDDAEGPFPVLVWCDQGIHDVPVGTDCPHCGKDPKCAGCPGKEE